MNALFLSLHLVHHVCRRQRRRICPGPKLHYGASVVELSLHVDSDNDEQLQAFEWYSEGNGVHWNKLAKKTDELASFGITAMWLPRKCPQRHPLCYSDNVAAPTKAAGQESVGYDIYDLYDLGEFDQKGGQRTKYGTKEELLQLVKKAKERGMVTYIDAVLNHRCVYLFYNVNHPLRRVDSARIAQKSSAL